MITINEFEKASGIHFNKYMTAKMQGITCLGTSNLCNPFCAARKGNPDSVCAKCYADGLLNCRKNVAKNMDDNSRILTEHLFHLNELPTINAAIFRFEPFGDLINTTQARNYIRLAKVNPHVTFALWTKNPGILAQAVKLEGKPSNLIVILSSHLIGVKADPSRWDFVDKVFTVYRKDQIDSSEINCGSRMCLTCRKCYTHGGDNDIREYLKK